MFFYEDQRAVPERNKKVTEHNVKTRSEKL